MTTPLIRQIKKNNKNAQLDYCLAKPIAGVLIDNPYIDNLIELDDIVFSYKGIFKLIRFIISIRKKYDYIFILGKNWLSNLLFKLSNAQLIGFAREKMSQILLDKYVIYNDVNRYQVLYYLDLLKVSELGGVNYLDIKMDLNVSDSSKLNVDNQLKLLNVSKYIVVTNSGGNNQFEKTGIRMLPEDKIIQLLEKLLKTSFIILLGGNIDKDHYNHYIDKLILNTDANINNIVNFAGKLTIDQSVYLLSRAEAFYVTDCGAMHFGLAAGIDNKMTCFFGPTNPAHILPQDTKCNVVWCDQDKFNSDYQIYGRMHKPDVEYFRKLSINEII